MTTLGPWMDGNRGSGRTTLMVTAIMRYQTDNPHKCVAVVVVGSQLIDLMRRILALSGADMSRVTVMTSAQLDTIAALGIDAVFEDHCTIEHEREVFKQMTVMLQDEYHILRRKKEVLAAENERLHKKLAELQGQIVTPAEQNNEFDALTEENVYGINFAKDEDHTGGNVRLLTESISNVLHRSPPDEGPLKDDGKWVAELGKFFEA